MSTRSNIVIQNGSTRLYLYRHYDGYPGETGADLVEKLRASKGSVEAFIVALLGDQHPATSYGGPRQIYEVTSELHGDIEWIYALRFDGKEPAVAAIARSPGSDPDMKFRDLVFGPVSELVKLVNRDRSQMNARLAHIKAQNSNSLYAESEPYPMLAEEAACA